MPLSNRHFVSNNWVQVVQGDGDYSGGKEPYQEGGFLGSSLASGLASYALPAVKRMGKKMACKKCREYCGSHKKSAQTGSGKRRKRV